MLVPDLLVGALAEEQLQRGPPQPEDVRARGGVVHVRLPPLEPDLRPQSPLAQQTVMPSIAAARNACSIWARSSAVQKSSGSPQLIEITESSCLSNTAARTASIHPLMPFKGRGAR